VKKRKWNENLTCEIFMNEAEIEIDLMEEENPSI
jgi:hypothetical protein